MHTRAALLLAAAAATAGCGTVPAGPPRLARPVVLLGEVHDNAQQHALRLQAFADLLATGARPVLALEQFDRDRQAALDTLLARGAPGSPATPDELIAAAGGAGWDWTFYRPFLALALQHGLPVVAANVPRDEARAVMRDGLAARGYDAAVPANVLATLARGIEDSHCGLLDSATAGRMALAQVARDQFMARVLQAHADRGVVLLAGNGHVRTDLGAPRWLPPATRARSQAIGMLESGDDTAPYDQHVVTPVQPRPDPCEGMRRTQPAAQPASAGR